MKFYFIPCFSIGFFFLLSSPVKSQSSLSEVRQFQQKKIKTFVSDGSNKSQGLKFSIQYPSTYEAVDIKSPSVIKIFESLENNCAIVIAVSKREPISIEEEKYLLSEENLRSTVSQVWPKANFYGYEGGFTINNQNASYIIYDTKLNDEFSQRAKQYFIFYQNYLLTIGFTVLKENKFGVQKLEKKFIDYKPFFEVVINSLKFPEQEKKPRTTNVDRNDISITRSQNILNKGQNIELKKQYLPGIGSLYIPIILDTLGQSISRSILIDNTISNLSKEERAKIENDYKIRFTKSYLEQIRKSGYFYWPQKSLGYLLDTFFAQTRVPGSTINYDPEKFEVLPNIFIRKDTSATNSFRLKNVLLSDADSKKKFTETMKDTYMDLFKSLFSDIVLLDSSAQYTLFANDYPTVIISLTYTLPKINFKINETAFCIWKKNNSYIFRIEYKEDDKNDWDSYFADLLKLLELD